MMSIAGLISKEPNSEISIRKIRCVSSIRSTLNRKLPSIPLAGVWLKKAGFEVGDFARIIVTDGMLIISCERIPDNENRMD